MPGIVVAQEEWSPKPGVAQDRFYCNVYYVTVQITFHIPEFARKERNLHCDVVHITTDLGI